MSNFIYRSLIVMLLCFLCSLTGCFSRRDYKNGLAGFTKEIVEIDEERPDSHDSSQTINKTNNNTVVLSFFEIFNDTLVLYINKLKIKQWPMYSDSNKSTGYIRFDTLIYLKKKRLITVKMLTQKKYVELSIDNRSPFVTVQRYGGIWKVNYRRHIMVIK